MLSWTQDAAWEEILQEAVEKIQKYVEAGTYAEQMKSYSGIGVDLWMEILLLSIKKLTDCSSVGGVEQSGKIGNGANKSYGF